jgi:hypothetical protein
MTEKTPRFAAIIGHADEADLLAACIRHHLAIGAEAVFVSVNDDTALHSGSFDGDERVRAMRLDAFAATDNFHYFSHAMREVVEWTAPDWVFFADTDEMWLPESGRLADTRGLAETDLYIVERYNTLPQVLRSGEIDPPDLAEPFRQLLVLAREVIDEQYLGGDYRIPWIMGLDAPKLLVRPGLVQQVGTGGHSIRATAAGARWVQPNDLVILHAPFTTLARFRRKSAAVHAIMSTNAARFNSRQAWHWRYWSALSDDQLASEFRRQCVRASAVPLLRQQAVLGVVAVLYEQLRQRADKLDGDALHEFLGRAMTNYERP